MSSLIVRTQAEVLGDVQAITTDTGAAVWSTEALYRAINVGLRAWQGRVAIPQLYNLPSGFSAGTYEYAIPSYVGKNFRPYIKSAITNQYGIVLDSDDTYTWSELAGWTVEPAADGSRVLRLYQSPYTDDGRLIWLAPNGPVPHTLPTLTSGTLSSTATSLTTTAAVTSPIGDTGYIKIDAEVMFYAGVTRGSSSTTLSNLVRGLFGTTAASHTSTPTIYWCIAVDDHRLWQNLEDYAVARLHYTLLHRGTTDDRDNHERIMSYAQTRADQFWRMSGYVGQERTRIILVGAP